MIPNDRLKWRKDSDAPGDWLIRNVRLSNPAFYVYLAPLLLGATLPGENITDPGGWLVGFWRYPFVAVIVILQVISFAYGWLHSSCVWTKILAGIYIPLMGFWLLRNYFFGVEVNWLHCAQLFVLCLGITIIIDGVIIGRWERNEWQRQRRD